jgi:aminopeptidase N
LPERRAALAAFYQRWQDDPLVVDKWFALQARSSLPGTIAAVRADPAPAFTRANPNRLRALIGTFSQATSCISTTLRAPAMRSSPMRC